jgi:hypothetical protein
MLFLLCPSVILAASIDQFEGTYEGEAQFFFEGDTQRRDMSTTINATKTGFELSWTSVSYKDDGRTKAKTYTIEFIPSARENIYKSAMKKNLFGNDVPLDPLQGEPFVWARLEEDTLSVFSLFINSVGEYEVQEFHRTLVEAGLDLVFRRVHDGASEKEIRTFLMRVKQD